MALPPTIRPCAVDETARTGIPAPTARETRGGTILNKITIDRATVEQALETLLDCEDQLVKPYNRKAYYAAEALHSALEQPNEFHPDWDQIKPFNDRIAELEKVVRQALEVMEAASRIMDADAQQRQDDAIYALRQALSDSVEQPAQQEPTCKQHLQVWVISNGKGRGQFSWEPQDERYWTRMKPAVKQSLTVEQPVEQGKEPKNAE